MVQSEDEKQALRMLEEQAEKAAQKDRPGESEPLVRDLTVEEQKLFREAVFGKKGDGSAG